MKWGVPGWFEAKERHDLNCVLKIYSHCRLRIDYKAAGVETEEQVEGCRGREDGGLDRSCWDKKQLVRRSGWMIRMRTRHHYRIARRTQRRLPEKRSILCQPGKTKCFPPGKNTSGGGNQVGWAEEVFYPEERILRAQSCKVQHRDHSMLWSI